MPAADPSTSRSTRSGNWIASSAADEAAHRVADEHHLAEAELRRSSASTQRAVARDRDVLAPASPRRRSRAGRARSRAAPRPPAAGCFSSQFCQLPPRPWTNTTGGAVARRRRSRRSSPPARRSSICAQVRRASRSRASPGSARHAVVVARAARRPGRRGPRGCEPIAASAIDARTVPRAMARDRPRHRLDAAPLLGPARRDRPARATASRCRTTEQHDLGDHARSSTSSSTRCVERDPLRGEHPRRRAVPGRGRDRARLARRRATGSTSRATAPTAPTRPPRAGSTRIGMPYDDLHCSYDKVTRCVELGIDVLVDDSPVNLARAPRRGHPRRHDHPPVERRRSSTADGIDRRATTGASCASASRRACDAASARPHGRRCTCAIGRWPTGATQPAAAGTGRRRPRRAHAGRAPARASATTTCAATCPASSPSAGSTTGAAPSASRA